MRLVQLDHVSSPGKSQTLLPAEGEELGVHVEMP